MGGGAAGERDLVWVGRSSEEVGDGLEDDGGLCRNSKWSGGEGRGERPAGNGMVGPGVGEAGGAGDLEWMKVGPQARDIGVGRAYVLVGFGWLYMYSENLLMPCLLFF
jgi:hypothetical protein